MNGADKGLEPSSKVPGLFATTHWSVVLAAGEEENTPESAAALEELCRTYWYPIYAFVRRQGHTEEDARDLTQEFFARLLAKRYLSAVCPERGRFRWFLLSTVKRFLLKERERATAAKRGGGRTHLSIDGEEAETRYRLEAPTEGTPDKLFDRAWAANLIQVAYQRLEEGYTMEDKSILFEKLRVFLSGDRNECTYKEVGVQLGMTEAAVKVAVHRLRRRYQDVLRKQVAQTVATAEDLEEELSNLRAAFCA
jgi:RNA polymerase sigma factor (sigma-70 family)